MYSCVSLILFFLNDTHIRAYQTLSVVAPLIAMLVSSLVYWFKDNVNLWAESWEWIKEVWNKKGSGLSEETRAQS